MRSLWMIQIAIGIIVSCLATSSFPNSCKCTAPLSGEVTHDGGNQLIRVKEKRSYRSVHGVVRDVNGKLVSDVLVEVFDHPEWIESDSPTSPMVQRRVAACKTATDGQFCFENISAGSYELRASKDLSWNPSHIYITVKRANRKNTRARITVRLTPGT